MLPGLTKGHCSMFGAWGEAVPAGNFYLEISVFNIFILNIKYLFVWAFLLCLSNNNTTQTYIFFYSSQ